MHFMALVIGDKVDDQLGSHISTDYEFIVSRELDSLFEENGVPYSSDKVLNIVRDYVGRTGKLAVVAKERVAQECPRLYQSGIEDFMTIDNGKFVAVNRILFKRGQDIRDPEEHDVFEKLRATLKASGDADETVAMAKDLWEDLKEDGKVGNQQFEPKDVVRKIETVIDHEGFTKPLDSYEIGGQWANFLIAKEGTQGRRGPNSPKVEGRYDRLKLRDIDFDAMYQEATKDAAAEYDVVHEVVNGRSVRPYIEFINEVGKELYAEMEAGGENTGPSKSLTKEASKRYHEQEVIKDLQRAGHYFNHDSIFGDKQTYLDRVARPALLPFAVVKGGEWFQRGRMSWFGMLEEAMSWEEWEEEVKSLLDSVPGGTWITVVDCHR